MTAFLTLRRLVSVTCRSVFIRCVRQPPLDAPSSHGRQTCLPRLAGLPKLEQPFLWIQVRFEAFHSVERSNLYDSHVIL